MKRTIAQGDHLDNSREKHFIKELKELCKKHGIEMCIDIDERLPADLSPTNINDDRHRGSVGIKTYFKMSKKSQ